MAKENNFSMFIWLKYKIRKCFKQNV